MSSMVRSKMSLVWYRGPHIFEVQLVHLYKVHLFVDDLDDPKTHNGRSGVYSQYDLFRSQNLRGI
jgi:hypothetical protein